MDIKGISYQRYIIEPQNNGEEPQLNLTARYNGEEYRGIIPNDYLLADLKGIIIDARINHVMDVDESDKSIQIAQTCKGKLPQGARQDELLLFRIHNNALDLFAVLSKLRCAPIDDETIEILSRVSNALDNVYLLRDFNILLHKMGISEQVLYWSCINGEPTKSKQRIITTLHQRRLRLILGGLRTWEFDIHAHKYYENSDIVGNYISEMKTKEIAQRLFPELQRYLGAMKEANVLILSDYQRVAIHLVRLQFLPSLFLF
jgi:hypothetical protein